MASLLELKDKIFNTIKTNPFWEAVKPQAGTLATAGRNAYNSFASRPLSQRLQPTARRIEQFYNTSNPAVRIPAQFASGLIQGQNLGVMGPYTSPRTTGEQIAGFAGNVLGSFNPKGITQRAIRPIIRATDPIISKAIGPVANKAITGRVAAGVGNVAQGAFINPIYRQKPLAGAGFDFATGVAFGPNQFRTAVKANFSLDKNTFDEILQAESMLRNPKKFIGKITTGERTQKEALKRIQEQGVEIVERLSAKYLPDAQLNRLKTPAAKIKALVDLSQQNKLANVPGMGLTDGKPKPGVGGVENYHWYDNSSKQFKPVKDAKPIEVVKDVDSFISRDPSYPDSKTWVITEARSGTKIGGGRTQKEALANAQKAFADYKGDPKELIDRATKYNGLSPRYNVAQPPIDDIAKEARKYKSAEEAVTGKPVELKVYRSGRQSRERGGANFFSTNPDVAKEFSIMRGSPVEESVVNLNKPYVTNDRYSLMRELFDEKTAEEVVINGNYKKFGISGKGEIDPSQIEEQIFIPELKKRGFDGVVLKMGQSDQPEVITIYNQATQASKGVKIKPSEPVKIKGFEETLGVKPDTSKKIPELSQQEGQEQLTKALINEEERPEVFKQAFDEFIGQRDVARTTGAQAGIDFNDLPKSKAEEFINHAEGVKQSSDPEIVKRAGEWKAKTDALYTDLKSTAESVGADLGYIDRYVTHYWKETPEQVQKILSAKGRNFGSRTVPTYAEGKSLGLTPKYDNPAQILSEYVTNIEKTKANINLFKNMQAQGLIVPGSIGRSTPGFSPVDAPGFPKSTSTYNGKTVEGSYYAPTSIAKEINRIFSPEDFGKVGRFFGGAAKISKGTQDVVLSGGLPGTPVNAFSAAQVLKEFTSGSFVRPLKSLAQSITPNQSLNYFKANAEQIKKMQARNVIVRSSFDTEGLKGGGSVWDRLVSEPTFKRFMPTMQIEFFNHIEKKALGMGKGAEEAADIAAKAVSNWYGLTNTGNLARRSQLGIDITSTFAFAPTYRESMINLWTNSVKALGGITKLENRQNLKFLAGAVATWGAMNYLNEQLNGHPMSENPKGKEDKLLIPSGDTTIGIPFLSSIATVPRGIYRIIKDVLDVDFKSAGADTLRTFGSMLIKPIGEMILNEDYFGREIVDPNASKIEKGKQIASYLFKSNNHPYVRAALEAKGTPLYQTLSKAAELPFRFYKTSSIQNAPFWENYFDTKALDEQFQELKYTDPDKAVAFYNENKAQLDSLKSLKDQVSAYYETGMDSNVLKDGGVIQADGHMAFKGTDGKFHLIDTNFDVPPPEFTGNELLDKKIKSSYTSKITALEKNILTLFENGIITANQAEEALGGLKELKDAVKAPKKPKKISVKKLNLSPIKISKGKAPSITNLQIPPPPIKLTASSKVNVTKSPTVSLPDYKPNIPIKFL